MASENKDQLAVDINQFATKFHCTNQSGGKPGACNCGGKRPNCVSSGLSAELVLALLALGSEGETHNEILRTLNIPNDEYIRTNFGSMTAKLRNVQGVTLNMANKVYIKDGPHELTQSFKQDAEQVFEAEVDKLDFNDSAKAAETINNWVSGKTNNRIQNLLSPDSVTPDTKVVLVNALYFKGFWSKKFDPQMTREEDFFVTKDRKVPVQMMHASRHFNYGVCDILESQMLELKYEGEEASLLIVLPHKMDGLTKLMSKLAQNPELIDIPLRKTKIDVSIPKFRIETEIDLNALLPKMGIQKIFDPKGAEITKVLDHPTPLYVSKAIQKAFIEINEEGAEAAAATAAVMMLRCAMMNPSFQANKPFFYVLRVGNKNLFVGTYEGEQ